MAEDYHDQEQAIGMARAGGYLHPDFCLFWEDISPAEMESLADAIAGGGHMDGGTLVVSRTGETEKILEDLLAEFTVKDGRIHVPRPVVLLGLPGPLP